ncbi:hypothetical protein [Paraburkholderia sp. 40]|uniref:hypothetical protein n=1 Tax=Paraburkholderia sp. 40 TaxID=2991059 RepID=UPI003D219978
MSNQSFALLALKGRQRTVDLSAYQRWISIRDNIVRSRMVVQSLLQAKMLTKDTTLLVVGAGAAGASAAMAAAAKKVPTTLVDANLLPFSTQTACDTRYIAPCEYDWPHLNWNWEQYPSDFFHVAGYEWLEWAHFSQQKSLWRLDCLHMLGTKTASAHAEEMEIQLEKFIQRHPNGKNLHYHGNTHLTHTDWNRKLRKHEVTFDSPNAYDPALPALSQRFSKENLALRKGKFDFLIFATGYGFEATTWNTAINSPYPVPQDLSKPFWSNDTLQDKFLGFDSAPSVLIIGNGDGALQDFWRALVVPSAARTASEVLAVLTTEIDSEPDGARTLEAMHRKLSLAEDQAVRAQYWHSLPNDRARIYEALDRVYFDAMSELWQKFPDRMAKILHGLLRDDAPKLITLVAKTRVSHKVYGLNRFIFHLLNSRVEKFSPARVKLIHDEAATLSAMTNGGRPFRLVLSPAGKTRHQKADDEYDLVIVRTGPKNAASPFETPKSIYRQALGWVPAPYTSIS